MEGKTVAGASPHRVIASQSRVERVTSRTNVGTLTMQGHKDPTHRKLMKRWKEHGDQEALKKAEAYARQLSQSDVEKERYKGNYILAKYHGDADAALYTVNRVLFGTQDVTQKDIVRSTVLKELAERLDEGKPVVFVPVINEEGKRSNALPAMYARVLANYLGGTVETGLVKTSTSHGTGMSKADRAHLKPTFEMQKDVGELEQVVLVDDQWTSGNTVLALWEKINEIQGVGMANSPVAAVATLSASYRGIKPQQETLTNLLNFASITEKQFSKEFGYDISDCTESRLQSVLAEYRKNQWSGRGHLFRFFPKLESGSRETVSGHSEDIERGTTIAESQVRLAEQEEIASRREGPKRYRVTSALDVPTSPVNAADLAAVFPNAHITPSDIPGIDGYTVETGNVSFVVRSCERIAPDASTFRLAYGRDMKPDEQIAGAVQDGEILIASIGDRNTVRHESYHLLEDLGLVTPNEKNILTHAAQDAVRAGTLPDLALEAQPDELRAFYVEQQLARREFDRRTPVGRVLQKLGDFADSLANLALRTERGILRDLESGKFFETREPTRESPPATHYAATPGQAPSQPGTERTWLNLTYDEKDEARENGALWDGLENRWFAPKGREQALRQWLPREQEAQPRPTPQAVREAPPRAEQTASRPTPAKTWLNVSYREKDEAKQYGAKWDGQAKRWFAPQGADLDKLQRWLPTPEQERARRPAPAVVDPRLEFGDKLREAGLVIEGDPVMNGQRQRVPVQGGKPGSKDGSYLAYADGRPNGTWQNWKTGEQGKWIAGGHTLTAEARQDLRQQRDARVAAAEQARQEAQDRALKRAYARWMNAEQANPEHPYLQRKGVPALGLRQDGQGNLLVPGYDVETGRLLTLERINQNGGKWYEKDCPKKGAMAILPDKDALQTGEVVLMVEGYATGASVHQATGLPVAVAFDAGNIREAAAAIKRKMPNVQLTICADNDAPRISDAKNVGVVRAKQAAAAVPGCKVVVADFTHDEKSRGLTDFNDLHQSRGLGAVRDQIMTRVNERDGEEAEL